MKRIFCVVCFSVLLILMFSSFTIKTIDNIKINIIVNSKYSLPKTVEAKMSNNSIKKLPIKWNKNKIITSKPGTYYFYGNVDNYKKQIKLELHIIEKMNITESLMKDYTKFNFILNYGIKGKNQLNTINKTFSKDMIIDPNITTNLALNKEEIIFIFNEMRRINLFNYPKDVDSFFKQHLTPEQIEASPTQYEIFELKVIYGDKEKYIYWSDMYQDKSKLAVNLRNLFSKIKNIIVNHDEYKKLPVSSSSYE